MDLAQLAHQCAPEVAYSTLAAIVRTESGGHPWAIGVNGARRLSRQPASREEAVRWARWLVREGYNVDIGLMQVSSRHLARFRLDVADLLDPCTNLRAGSIVLREFYAQARAAHGHADSPRSVLAAISGYNTGSLTRGFANGYVSKVTGAPARALPAAEQPPNNAQPATRRESITPDPTLVAALEAPTGIPAASSNAPSVPLRR